MSGLGTVALTVCCASLICALLSNFVSDGSLKRILNLVLGAFVVCSLIFPVKTAFADFQNDIGSEIGYSEGSATFDEAYNQKIVAQTRQNLEQTLAAILNQNGIYPEKTEVILSVNADNSIIISRVCIYIDESNLQTDLIDELTIQNFGIKPNIITEQRN